jgi:transposase-like protein
MRRKRHSPEQVVRKLREAEADLASGTALDQVCKKLGVSEATYHRWRKQYGGAGADEVKRLKELEKENARLKAIVADLELDKRILKEALEGNY